MWRLSMVIVLAASLQAGCAQNGEPTADLQATIEAVVATQIANQPTPAAHPTSTGTPPPTPTTTPADTPTPTVPPALSPLTPQTPGPEGALEPLEALVVNVVDRETIDVLIKGAEYRIRYVGIDAGVFTGIKPATLTVCSNTSLDTRVCDYIADGVDDQEEINQALEALPASGGKVLVAEGTYSIDGVPNTAGGILIDKSNVVLEGSGPATKFVLTDGNTDTNVIRVGNSLENVRISDIWIDARGDYQFTTPGGGHPFEANGIRSGAISGRGSNNVVVERVRVEACRQLCIMLFGENVVVRNNWVGNARSDAVELLIGPGAIVNNQFFIDDSTSHRTGVVISTDAAHAISIIGNDITVTNGVSAGVGIRTWQDFTRHTIQDNVIRACCGATIDKAMTIGTSDSVISGNIVDGNTSTGIDITASNVLMTDNLFRAVQFNVNDAQLQGPIVVRDNLFDVPPILNIESGVFQMSDNVGVD